MSHAALDPEFLNRPGWLFDLDGTLIDSSRAVVRAFHVAQARFGEPPADAATIRSRIGYPLRETVAQLTQIGFDEFLAAFRAEARRSMHLDTVLLPGVEELLHFLVVRSRLCAVVTSKERENACSLLKHLGVAHFITTVVGEDCTTQTKPHPAPLWEAARRLQLAPGQLVMVGDTQNDLLAARRAGLPVIALTTGHDPPEQLVGADLILDDARALLHLLDLSDVNNRP